MSELASFFDVDAISRRLVQTLRARGMTVRTAQEMELKEVLDEKLLEFSSRWDFVLYTYNAGDFYRLHADWIRQGRRHTGIIIGDQQRFSTGTEARLILMLKAVRTREQMVNHVEFISNWRSEAL